MVAATACGYMCALVGQVKLMVSALHREAAAKGSALFSVSELKQLMAGCPQLQRAVRNPLAVCLGVSPDCCVHGNHSQCVLLWRDRSA